ncbi:serine protease [Methylomonas methanica]|uniref:Tetratricopeptide TPR_4 n=1 Tax=Methylomonas methanica (strain DSM 25384 / MC09) TaxID=857087 RepID=G0A4W1_METMM|nr:serine protease [Methylomonas methanica]AEF99124.1 tetratricopeptide TPR_4 [Methylomonas methanica MC09]
MKKIVLLLCVGAYLSEVAAKALDSVEIYEQVQRSVTVLEELDDTGKPLQALSAIAVASDRAVTMCDAMSGTRQLRIVTKNNSFPATILARDGQRHLCLLSVPGAELTQIVSADVNQSIQSGARVYALSNALGLGVGISEGVVSGVRPQFGVNFIQFSAPVSPGSDGGALVDAEGRLLGIITYRHHDGQNVNFAIPAKWLAEIEQHDKSDIAYKQFRETAEQLQQQEQWQKLADHVEQWIVGHQNDADAWLWVAVAAEKIGNLDNEENAWRRLHQLDPTSSVAAAGLVSVKLKRNQRAEALQLAHELLSLRQEDADIWTIVGQTEQVAGTAAKAEEAYRKALTFNPWQLAAYQGLIGIAEQRNDQGMVTQLWQSLTALNPDVPAVQFKLAEAYIREGRPARAYSLLEKLTVPDTQKADTDFWKGQTLIALGRPLDATQAFEKSLQGNPTSKASVYAALGSSYFQLQRFPESIQAYREAVRLEPNNPEWLYGLALSLKDGFRGREALEIDAQLLKKFPNDAAVWRQKGFTEAILGRHQEGIKSMEKSLELDPKQGKLWVALIETYRQAGRDKDATSAYERLRGIDSEWAEKAYRSAILPFEESQP